MTDREHNIDVLGAYPAFDAASDEDQELDLLRRIIDQLADDFRHNAYKLIELVIARRGEKLELWPSFECAALSKHSTDQPIEVTSTE